MCGKCCGANFLRTVCRHFICQLPKSGYLVIEGLILFSEKLNDSVGNVSPALGGNSFEDTLWYQAFEGVVNVHNAKIPIFYRFSNRY